MLLIIVLVLLGVALVAVYINREKDEEKARLAILGLTAAIVVVAIMSILGIGGGGGPQFDTSVDQGIGEVAADRIAGVAKGTRVVLVADTNPHNPFARSRVEGFQQRMAVHNKEIVGVQDPWPTDFGAFDFPEEGLSSWGIEQALLNYPDVEIIISLAGFPTHGFEKVAGDLRELEFYAIDENYLTDWVSYLRQGVLNGLIVPPYDANWSDTSGSAEDVFERRYVFVTPANFSEVSSRFVDPYEQATW